jgi:hypothetical protein
LLAIELARPSLGWTLITTAARMAQDAGYHRLPPYSVAPEATKKRLIFWFIYAIDRGMSLNLGRPPTLQDYDISVDRPRVPEEINDWYGRMYLGWIDFAELQGQIYEQLYSARAQRQPPETKVPLARALAARALKMKEVFAFDVANYPFEEDMREALLSTQIVLVCAQTLIYRMIPPAPSPSNRPHHPLKFCDEALAAAREALTMHNHAWNILKHRGTEEWQLFIHWTLLWCPFIPYIVVFGNVIADRNAQDLKLLEQVVDTLQKAAALGPGVRKLYHACRNFHQIGSMYLSQGGTGDVNNTSSQQGPQPTTTSATSGHLQTPQTSEPSSLVRPDFPFADTGIPDLPLFQPDWDGIQDGWDFNFDDGTQRDMSAFFGQYLNGPGNGFQSI